MVHMKHNDINLMEHQYSCNATETLVIDNRNAKLL